MEQRRVPIPWATAARVLAHGNRLAITAALQQTRGAIAMEFNNGAGVSRRLNKNLSNAFAIVGSVNGHGDPVAQALDSIQSNETRKLFKPKED